MNGWDNFGKKISSGLDTLRDGSKTAEYPDGTDGDDLVVEVATKNRYRITTYKMPGYSNPKIFEAKID